MRLKVWGARGSIPVSGAQYLKYGGDTTCLELQTAAGDILVLDAGNGVRALGNEHMSRLTEPCVLHFLFTHAHWDHLLGFPFYKPLYHENAMIRLSGCADAQRSIRTFLKQTMQAPFFPVELDDVAATLQFEDECPSDFHIGELHCQSFPLNHPNGGFGFKLSEAGKSVAFFPDNELSYPHPGGESFEAYAKFVAGVDLLIHDAEYLPEEYQAFSRGWGHSVYLDTVRLAIQAGVKRLLLWHHNQERDDAELDEMVRRGREAIAAAGSDLVCEAATMGMTLTP